MLAELLFPGIAGVHIDTVRVETPTFHLYVSTTQPTSDCPVCHTPSAAIHSRYWGGTTVPVWFTLFNTAAVSPHRSAWSLSYRHGAECMPVRARLCGELLHEGIEGQHTLL